MENPWTRHWLPHDFPAGRATYRKMIENLAWATGYNLIAIPVAAGVLIRWGIDLPMSVGAIAMSASTLIVAANAQLLRGLKLRHGPSPGPPLSRYAAPATLDSASR